MIEKIGVSCPRCKSAVVIAISEEMEPTLTCMLGKQTVPCPVCGQDMRLSLAHCYNAVRDANRAEKELSEMKEKGILTIY